MNKKTLITLISVFLVLALAIGGTFAYLYGESDVVKNHFNANKVTVELTETKTPADAEGVHNYEIIPGTSAEKDPTVTVENTVDAYAFVKITDELDGKAMYNIAPGWQKLEGAGSEKAIDVSGVQKRVVETVYYREVKKGAATKTFSVLAGDMVYYSGTLTNEQVAGGGDLSFKAYAIQKDPFGDPAAAWFALNPEEVSDSSSVATALAAGKSVKLTEDVVLDETISIPSGKTVTIDLNGKTLTGAANSTVLDIDNSTVTITGNGEIDASPARLTAAIAVHNGATLNYLNGTLKVAKATTGSGGVYGIYLYSKEIVNLGELGTEGPTMEVYGPCLATNGTYEGGTFNIYSGSYTSTRVDGDGDSNVIQIANTNYVNTVNIYGGTFTQTATPADGMGNIIELRYAGAKVINIQGGTFICANDTINVWPNDSRFTANNYTLTVADGLTITTNAQP